MGSTGRGPTLDEFREGVRREIREAISGALERRDSIIIEHGRAWVPRDFACTKCGCRAWADSRLTCARCGHEGGILLTGHRWAVRPEGGRSMAHAIKGLKPHVVALCGATDFRGGGILNEGMAPNPGRPICEACARAIGIERIEAEPTREDGLEPEACPSQGTLF